MTKIQCKAQNLGELRMRDTANDGLTYLYVFTRGLLLVARGESDTS